MSALPMRSHLDSRQLEKLRRQEAEIAELRQRLSVARGGNPTADTAPESSTQQDKYALFKGGELPSLPGSAAQAAAGAAPSQETTGARLPQDNVEAQPACRVLETEQLSAATGEEAVLSIGPTYGLPPSSCATNSKSSVT